MTVCEKMCEKKVLLTSVFSYYVIRTISIPPKEI